MNASVTLKGLKLNIPHPMGSEYDNIKIDLEAIEVRYEDVNLREVAMAVKEVAAALSPTVKSGAFELPGDLGELIAVLKKGGSPFPPHL